MQTRNPFLDEVAKAVESAMGLAQTAGDEAKTVMRAQADKLATELDLVRRDEFEALRAALMGEIAALRAELAQSLTQSASVPPADDAG